MTKIGKTIKYPYGSTPDIKQRDYRGVFCLDSHVAGKSAKIKDATLVKKLKKTSKNFSLPPTKGFKAHVINKDKASKQVRLKEQGVSA